VANLYEPIPVGNHKIVLSLFGNFSGSDHTETKPNIVLNLVLLLVIVVVAVFAVKWFISNMLIAKKTKAEKEAEETEEAETSESELEEVTVAEQTPETTETLKPAEKPPIEEFIITKPKKRIDEIPINEPRAEEPTAGRSTTEIPMSKPRAEEKFISTGQEEEYKIVAQNEEYPAQRPEEKPKEEEEKPKKKTGLLPFMIPEDKEE